MPRIRDRLWRYEPTANATFELMMGPTDAPGELTVEQLEVAWEVERDFMMAHCLANPIPGWRPWAYWWFDLREEQPRGSAAETVRLAELGELTDDELVALRERANEARLRIGTAGERSSGGGREHAVSVGQQDVDLWDAVERARGRV